MIEISHWSCFSITVAFLRTFVIMMALYTKCLFFYYFFYNWWVSEQKSFLLLKIFSVSYRSDFSGSQSPSLMIVWSSLMKYHQQCHQFWAPANFVELFLDFCVKVSNKNPESETDFWEILGVLLLAWYLPFPFCYFRMWSAPHAPHWFLYQILFCPNESLIFCLARRVISKYFS